MLTLCGALATSSGCAPHTQVDASELTELLLVAQAPETHTFIGPGFNTHGRQPARASCYTRLLSPVKLLGSITPQWFLQTGLYFISVITVVPLSLVWKDR